MSYLPPRIASKCRRLVVGSRDPTFALGTVLFRRHWLAPSVLLRIERNVYSTRICVLPNVRIPTHPTNGHFHQSTRAVRGVQFCVSRFSWRGEVVCECRGMPRWESWECVSVSGLFGKLWRVFLRCYRPTRKNAALGVVNRHDRLFRFRLPSIACPTISYGQMRKVIHPTGAR